MHFFTIRSLMTCLVCMTFLIGFEANALGQTSVVIEGSGNSNGIVTKSVVSPIEHSSSQVDAQVDLSGQWCGNWRSCKNGHQGKLAAQFCRLDACHVRATFRGTFAKVIPFRYPATLKIVDEKPGLLVLSGSQKLGPIMGSFEYQVTITDNSFRATYRSKRDWGVWTLKK